MTMLILYYYWFYFSARSELHIEGSAIGFPFSVYGRGTFHPPDEPIRMELYKNDSWLSKCQFHDKKWHYTTNTTCKVNRTSYEISYQIDNAGPEFGGFYNYTMVASDEYGPLYSTSTGHTVYRKSLFISIVIKWNNFCKYTTRWLESNSAKEEKHIIFYIA